MRGKTGLGRLVSFGINGTIKNGMLFSFVSLLNGLYNGLYDGLNQ